VVVPIVRGSSVRKMLHVSIPTQNFDVATRVLENLQTPCHRTCYLRVQYIGNICMLHIGIYKSMSKLRTYTHIYRGFFTVFVTDNRTGMSMHTVL
jgi:hypothetical protein